MDTLLERIASFVAGSFLRIVIFSAVCIVLTFLLIAWLDWIGFIAGAGALLLLFYGILLIGSTRR